MTTRRLASRECERLQGFPDDWTLVPVRTTRRGSVRWTSDAARYRALGNAVTVNVVEQIARRMMAVETQQEPTP